MSNSTDKELRNRLDYLYLQTDGTYKFPNSAEGDLLKMTHKLLTELPTLQNKAVVAARIDELKGIQLEYGHYMAQTFIDGKPITIQERIKQLTKKGQKEDE